MNAMCFARSQLTPKHITAKSYLVVGASTVFPLLAATCQQLQSSGRRGGLPGARSQGPRAESCSY